MARFGITPFHSSNSEMFLRPPATRSIPLFSSPTQSPRPSPLQSSLDRQVGGADPKMVEEDCAATQLIDRNGSFDAVALDRFLKAARLADCGISYAVVSIMGPQSSGKSTLLNHLFGTNFVEMDAYRGRNQTTKGIWIAKGIGIEPSTIVLDLEGTDGRERGEDDTAFEKQSALFALAISDILLINLWCHDIGREHAANKPLLKLVFQVMTHLFSPRKTTLLFVIRDKTKTPMEHLEKLLREDIQKIWDSVPRSQAHKETLLSDYFNVEVTALPSYEEKEELFKEQVSQLRQRFFHSIAPGGLAGDRRGVVPASGFSISVQQIWKVIRENKDLDIPSHKIMVATVRCEEIANEKLRCLASDKVWLDLEASVKVGPVSGFGRKLDAILDAHLSEYDMETIYFDDGVRTAKRQQLESKALNLVYPAFQAMLGYLRSKALDKFRNNLEQSLKNGRAFAESVHTCKQASLLEFDTRFTDVAVKHADWNPLKIKEKLDRDIDAHAASVRSSKLSELRYSYEKQIKEALAEPVESLLDSSTQDTWASIRKLYKHVTGNAQSRYSSSLSGFELEQPSFDKMMADLKDYARGIVVRKVREEASMVLEHMKDRFLTVFSHDKDSMPRVWTGKEDIRMITREARTAALKLLAVMAAIRLDDHHDNIENILSSSLMDGPVVKKGRVEICPDPLASSTWEAVLADNTVITPVQCKLIWKQFKAETEYIVALAISAREANKCRKSWLPPPWAIVAIAVLGFNEFMILLRSPLYLVILFIIFLLSRALWIQLNIAGHFQNGMLPGLVALSTRLLLSVTRIMRRSVGIVHRYQQTPPSPPGRYGSSWTNFFGDSEGVEPS